MYGIYGNIVDACERALTEFDETAELLEFPEVQADRKYYLSVLSKYNGLKSLKERLEGLKRLSEEEKTVRLLMSETDNQAEKDVLSEEASLLKKRAASVARELASLLGIRPVAEEVVCRLKASKENASVLAEKLFELLKADMTAHGVTVGEVRLVRQKGDGYVREIDFAASGAEAMRRISVLSGVHKVYIPSARSEEISLAVAESARPFVPIEERDIKIDLFHSSGAGGQNINKVETAVRVTHIPTGTVVVCQDERSQLKNKRRALETLNARLEEQNAAEEKKRIEKELLLKLKPSTITFDLGGTMSDTRSSNAKKMPFPPTEGEFSLYVDGLVAQGK